MWFLCSLLAREYFQSFLVFPEVLLTVPGCSSAIFPAADLNALGVWTLGPGPPGSARHTPGGRQGHMNGGSWDSDHGRNEGSSCGREPETLCFPGGSSRGLSSRSLRNNQNWLPPRDSLRSPVPYNKEFQFELVCLGCHNKTLSTVWLK